MKYEFFIPGKPVRKGRPRFARMGKFTKVFTDEKTLNYENKVEFYTRRVIKDPIPDGVALRVVLDFYIERPKSKPKKIIHHVTKPDADNLAKCVLDGMKKVIRDQQICILNIRKQYAVDHEEGCQVMIENL